VLELATLSAVDLATMARAAATLLWPVAVIVALLVFRRQLGALIERLQSAKFPGGEVVLATAQIARVTLDEVAHVEAVPSELRARAASTSGALGVAFGQTEDSRPRRTVAELKRAGDIKQLAVTHALFRAAFPGEPLPPGW
jgi:hypothetical protein